MAVEKGMIRSSRALMPEKPDVQRDCVDLGREHPVQQRAGDGGSKRRAGRNNNNTGNSGGAAHGCGSTNVDTDTVALERLRLWIVGVIVLGLVGTMTELLLLEHDEEALQFVPLVLMVLGAVALAWHAISKDTASLRTLQVIMGLFVLSGSPAWRPISTARWSISSSSTRTWSAGELLDKIARAKAPPLLAPGMMIQNGPARPCLCVHGYPLQRE